MLSSLNHFAGIFLFCMYVVLCNFIVCFWCKNVFCSSRVRYLQLFNGAVVYLHGPCWSVGGTGAGAHSTQCGHPTSPCADQWQGHTFPTASVYKSSLHAGWQGAEDFLAKLVVVDVTWSSALEFGIEEVLGCLPAGCGGARSDASVLKAKAEHRWGKQPVPF